MIDDIQQLMRSHNYRDAEEAMHRLLDEGEHDPRLLAALARCQLALEKFDEALHNYTHLLHHSDEADVRDAVEAALVLDKTKDALPLCRAALAQRQNDAEFHFLAALVFYKHGHIKSAAEQLDQAIRLDFHWDDEDPIDFVAQQVLPVREFHDFEQIYLDAVERVKEGNANARNRWFSLNMPTWDLLKASVAERQQKRALELAELLSPRFDAAFLATGKNKLRRIVEDLAGNEGNAEFCKQMRRAITEDELPRAARLVLALELAHLKQFASLVGLSESVVTRSPLQQLITLLPLRLAVGIIFLYSASGRDEHLPNYEIVKLSGDLFAGLIAACFASFYQQVDALYFRQDD